MPTRKWNELNELRDKMSPESRARARAMTEAIAADLNGEQLPLEQIAAKFRAQGCTQEQIDHVLNQTIARRGKA